MNEVSLQKTFQPSTSLLNAAQANYSRSTMHDLLLACLKKDAYRIRRSAEGCSPCKSDLCKSGPLHQPDLVPDRDRAANSVRPGFRTLCQMGGQFTFNYHVGKLEPPARLENPEELPETGWFVRDEIDDAV